MNARSLSSVSFRDPAGFVYSHQGELRRQVSQVYREHYDRLLSSGLYDELIQAGLLVPHEEISTSAAAEPDRAYRVLRPERVEFISYPGEWSFSAFQDAALVALEVQRRALERGMTLKDCSAFNFPFHNGRPVLIDTLSFEIDRDEPWSGYRQFCEHFLAPLALMALLDGRLGQICRSSVDGVPIDLAARLLPWRSMLRFGLAVHLHLHSAFQRGQSGATTVSRTARVTKAAKLGLVDSLRSTVSGLRWKHRRGEWESYYDEHSYTPAEFDQKAATVKAWIQQTGTGTVWDLGANTGYFSFLACELSRRVVAFESDAACVDRIYVQARDKGETRLLALVQDLANPTPSFGWENCERASIFERGRPDLVLALALVHHLVLAGNQPLENVAAFFSRLTPSLVIEFVPEDDPQAISLSQRTRGIHHPYDRAHFERCMGQYFDVLSSVRVTGGGRMLYLMRSNQKST
jgi:hypothetical protein